MVDIHSPYAITVTCLNRDLPAGVNDDGKVDHPGDGTNDRFAAVTANHVLARDRLADLGEKKPGLYKIG